MPPQASFAVFFVFLGVFPFSPAAFPVFLAAVSLLLGMYDKDGNFIYIGHAGTGKLKRAEWVSLTKLVEPLKRAASPFSNKPERIKQTQWLKPELTVKIQYIEWPQGRSVRQPSIQSFMNIPPEECILPDEQILEKQKL
jgi:bifunctional non-homologous end joining protein LigD